MTNTNKNTPDNIKFDRMPFQPTTFWQLPHSMLALLLRRAKTSTLISCQHFNKVETNYKLIYATHFDTSSFCIYSETDFKRTRSVTGARECLIWVSSHFIHLSWAAAAVHFPLDSQCICWLLNRLKLNCMYTHWSALKLKSHCQLVSPNQMKLAAGRRSSFHSVWFIHRHCNALHATIIVPFLHWQCLL